MAKAPAEIRSLAREHTRRAIAVLAGIMDQPKAPPAARVAAACALLDRGWGKPVQATTIAGPGDGPIPLAMTNTREWLAEKVAGIAARVNAEQQ